MANRFWGRCSTSMPPNRSGALCYPPVRNPAGFFLIEHPDTPLANPLVPTAVVTVVEVADIQATLNRAAKFGAPVSETVTDTTPEGMRFSEAMITSPGGHAILVYEIGALSDTEGQQTE
jgi:hypothetical protein